MPGRRGHEAVTSHAFALEVDGVRVATLTEVEGLSIESDVVEVKQTGADGRIVVRRLPGGPKAGEVTVSRGLSDDRTFEQWMSRVSLGGNAPGRDAVVVVVDHEGGAMATFTLAKAWPRRLEYDNLRSDATEPPVERLVLVHEGLTRA